MADLIQADRILRVETPLGPDMVLPERVEIAEAVSDLFTITLAVRSPKVDIRPQDLVGELVDVSLELGAGVRRTWNGLVTHLQEGPRESRAMRSYSLVVRPEHWLLSQNADCRIFLDKTSVEVAQILLSEHGLAAPVTTGVAVPVPAQHYSVQWNETDLDYLKRRLEADGLFFWFEHLGGAPGVVAARHVMHIANHAVGYSEDPFENGDVRFAMGSTDRNHISSFDRAFAFVPGKRSSRDWNFETPGAVPGGTTPGLVQLPRNGVRELYEWPAVSGYGTGTAASEGIDDAEVERRSRLRMQAAEVDHEQVSGTSNVRTLAAGRRVRPYDVANPDNVFEEHVVTAVRMIAVDRSYETQSDEPEYRNAFEAVPSRVPMTPHRTTRRPKIEGTQIAFVAGPAGEEIHPDQYGRIKLWFPWDRRAKADGSDTCWVRVGQTWAGAGWGAQTVPRIGMEVLVAHIDGDPDRPLVTGVVPNARQKVPYELPGNKTRTVLRSQSHKRTGFNEITFEDEGGQENVFHHAQKDFTTRVLNDRTERVDRHEVASVGGNRAVEVAQNQKTEVGGSMNLTVGGTGAGALGLMSQVAGIAGQTSGLLAKAGHIAGGGAALTGFAGTIASSALGFLSGGGLQAREGVVAGDNPRADAGTALAGSGSGVGEDASGLFPMSGIMNTVVGSFKSDSVGVASVEQVGTSKVTNVGATFVENVGLEQLTTVGRKVEVQVGNLYRLLAQQKFSGEATTWEIRAEDKLYLSAPGGYIEINKEGIRIRGLRIDIEGNRINFARGGPGEGAVCLREMANRSTPFVRG